MWSGISQPVREDFLEQEAPVNLRFFNNKRKMVSRARARAQVVRTSSEVSVHGLPSKSPHVDNTEAPPP